MAIRYRRTFGTVQIAIDAKREIESEEWYKDDGFMADGETRSVFLGTVFGLDPCGRYHHFLSPNGVTSRCERFWESLENQLSRRGLSLESGEGDPCDQYAVEYRDLDDSNE